MGFFDKMKAAFNNAMADFTGENEEAYETLEEMLILSDAEMCIRDRAASNTIRSCIPRRKERKRYRFRQKQRLTSRRRYRIVTSKAV